ncbi:hypothetical protein PQQ63_15225 [Paraburkholderia metrosideri]|uniref:Lipoprotein n=1 Tax=Paraburkholderia metrosideri TaxID=580937 RepID=A0ABW9DSR3_9BURK
MKKYTFLLPVVVLAACSSVSEVTQIGKDTYQVDATTRSGLMSHGETTALAIGKAREFCGTKGKELQSAPAKTSGARGWTVLESTVTFQCFDKDDPAFKRPELGDMATAGASTAK